ncbi:hypothetical protein Q1695_002570 [Nippostrongylus brasiliensis]|nr:hypothetical protein Q1695_002570 [Nippostrongylus brasiliensis]
MVAANVAIFLNVDQYQAKLAIGIFATLGCATNFFVYYSMSSKYRKIFDERLGLERLKGTMCWRQNFGHGATRFESPFQPSQIFFSVYQDCTFAIEIDEAESP